MIIKYVKSFKVFILILIIDAFLILIKSEMAKISIMNSFHFLIEVIKILPPILILMGLLDVWISEDKIQDHLGKNSGIKGPILSIVLGTAAAGPLFAAFPIALSLGKKGVRTANLVIFLSSWATIKIPMLIMESSFVGFKFSILRLIITLPFIFLMGYLMEKFAPIDLNE